MKGIKVYVVNAYRWGDREAHSYTVAVELSEDKAICSAKYHEEYRSGKYECEVLEFDLDTPNEYKIIKKLPNHFK